MNWRPQRDFNAEIDAHLQMEVDRLVAEGVPPAEAQLRARLHFGNVTRAQERFHDRRPGVWLTDFFSDFSHALGGLRRRPVFAATIVLTLTLGIGATSAIFSILDTVLLKPLPYPDADRIVSIDETNRDGRVAWPAPVRIEDWSRLTRSFSVITGYYSENMSDTTGSLPEKLVGAIVGPRFFRVWGIEPALGRGFSEEEQRFGGPNAVVISDRLWRHRYNGDRNAIGKPLRLSNSSQAVVGVMPAGFLFPNEDVDLWMPAKFPAALAVHREARFMQTFARLRPGVSLEAARRDLEAAQRQLAERFPKTDGNGWGTQIEPLKERTVGGVRRSLWILFGAVLLVVLIACGNVASLLLAQGRQREHEIAIRFTLGAGRTRVLRQLLTEGFALALLGAAGGLALAFAATAWLRGAATGLPRTSEIQLDWRLVLFTLALACLTTLLFGLAPSLGLARGLSGQSRGQISGRYSSQYLLVGSQIALTVVLLAGSGLLLRTMRNLNQVQAGFDPANVLTLRISASWGESGNPGAVRERLTRVIESLATLPGVEGVALTSSLSGLSGQNEGQFRYPDDATVQIAAHTHIVSSDYFRLLRIPILAGETCRATGDPVKYMVNRRFVEQYSPNRGILGRSLIAGGRDPVEIIGVVGDARESGLDREAPPAVYYCAIPGFYPDPHYLVRTAADPMTLVNAIRRKVHQISPNRSVFDVKPLTAHLTQSFAARRFNATLLTLFAGTALALAAIGLYGLMNFFVARRTREFGLRIAIGARPGQILWQVLRNGLVLTLAGIAAGLAAASLVSRWIASMLYGVRSLDALTFAAAACVLALVAAASALIPARRATMVDPVTALRDEP